VTSRGNEKKDIFRNTKDSYTTYFNVRHKKAGHLFQGRDLREGLKRLAENLK